MRPTTSLLLLCLTLSACSRSLTVTYQSDPPGALLYEGGKQWGYAPFALRYEPSAEFLKGGCMLLQPSMVRWASGAGASIPALTACASNGKKQQFVFLRPAEIPGRDLDAQFYVQMQSVAAQQQMADAQRRAVLLAFYNQLAQQNRVVIQQQPTPLNCTSMATGYQIQTTCR